MFDVQGCPCMPLTMHPCETVNEGMMGVFKTCLEHVPDMAFVLSSSTQV